MALFVRSEPRSQRRSGVYLHGTPLTLRALLRTFFFARSKPRNEVKWRLLFVVSHEAKAKWRFLHGTPLTLRALLRTFFFARSKPRNEVEWRYSFVISHEAKGEASLRFI